MAIPRMFISSTCYDLQEIRHNLRSFIKEFSYEPVMSEFGDIFYEFDAHTQDSCLREIEKSQMYILIIGNNYGSIFHKEKKDIEYPDSITLSEFKKSIEVNIPKIIFINKFVNYDYRNYKKSLNEHLASYFNSEKIKEENVESVRLKQIKTFDQKYYFPQESYKYIFRFLDIIAALPKNNAVFEYETFEEIKESLKKQWAGFLYDKLSDYQRDIEEQVTDSTLIEIKDKINILDRFLRDAFDKPYSKSGNLTISLKKIEDSFAIDDLKKAHKLLEDSLGSILFTYDSRNRYVPRIQITEELSDEKIGKWLKTLDSLINTYKWSPDISILEVFKGFEIRYWSDRSQIPLESLIKLNAFYKTLPENEIMNVCKTINIKFNQVIKVDKEVPDYPDDIPF